MSVSPVSFATSRMVNQEHLSALQGLFTLVRSLLERILPNCRAMAFGSVAHCLASPGCDLDICIFDSQTGWNRKISQIGSAQMLESMKSALIEVGCDSKDIVFVAHARVPVVKYTGNRWPHFDISSDTCGVITSHFLRRYITHPANLSLLQPCLRAVIGWCKGKGFIDCQNGWLSSCAVTLMVIYAAVQKGSITLIPWTVPDPDIVSAFPEHVEASVWDPSRVEDAIFEFFQFYGEQFQYITYIVQLRDPFAIVRKVDKGWKAVRLAIEDPFDPSVCLSRNLSRKRWALMRKEFRTAAQLMRPDSLKQQNGGDSGDE